MPMETKDTVRVLSRLVQLDVDASLAYDQALANVEAGAVRDALARFKSDHERHIEALSDAIRRLGREPPDRHRDTKGFFIEGFTAVRSRFGIEATLSALRDNAALAHETYGEALAEDLPDFCRVIVERNSDDEGRHVEIIEGFLQERIWEPRPRV